MSEKTIKLFLYKYDSNNYEKGNNENLDKDIIIVIK